LKFETLQIKSLLVWVLLKQIIFMIKVA
jgi:hypothetical protein